MEHCELGTIEEQHKVRPLSVNEIISITEQTARALALLHDKKITHRNVHPENILVRSRSTANRQEFERIDIALAGLSHAHSCDFYKGPVEEPYMFDRLGVTGFYEAPEMASRKARPKDLLERDAYSDKVDVWALGVTALLMFCDVTNKFPPWWPAQGGVGRVARNTLTSMGNVSTTSHDYRFMDIICRMLTVDPLNRPGAAWVMRNVYNLMWAPVV